jgi:hypothetical protein
VSAEGRRKTRYWAKNAAFQIPSKIFEKIAFPLEQIAK